MRKDLSYFLKRFWLLDWFLIFLKITQSHDLEDSRSVVWFWGMFAKLWIANIIFVMSAHPSAWNNSVPTGWIFMKFDWEFFSKICQKWSKKINSNSCRFEILKSNTKRKESRFLKQLNRKKVSIWHTICCPLALNT
jgi:hypothetical protein